MLYFYPPPDARSPLAVDDLRSGLRARCRHVTKLSTRISTARATTKS